jgi:SAM-dependent methyltransferase
MSQHSSLAANAQAFGAYAQDYAQHRPTYPQALWDWAASQCAEHQCAWDVGCGNGQAAVALATTFAHVTATDISAEQITAATLHPRITYSAVSAEQARIAPHSMDLICVAQALHWFDLEKFWPAVHAALKPGGLFMAVAYGAFHVDATIDAITHHHFYDVVQPFQSAGNHAVNEGYRSINFPLDMITAPPMHIEMQWSLEQLADYASTWSAVARMRKETGHDPIAPYRAALAAQYPPSVRTVRMPLTIKAGYLRRS